MLQIETLSQRLSDASNLWWLDNRSSSGPVSHVLCDLGLVNNHLRGDVFSKILTNPMFQRTHSFLLRLTPSPPHTHFTEIWFTNHTISAFSVWICFHLKCRLQWFWTNMCHHHYIQFSNILLISERKPIPVSYHLLCPPGLSSSPKKPQKPLTYFLFL